MTFLLPHKSQNGWHASHTEDMFFKHFHYDYMWKMERKRKFQKYLTVYCDSDWFLEVSSDKYLEAASAYEIQHPCVGLCN